MSAGHYCDCMVAALVDATGAITWALGMPFHIVEFRVAEESVATSCPSRIWAEGDVSCSVLCASCLVAYRSRLKSVVLMSRSSPPLRWLLRCLQRRWLPTNPFRWTVGR